MARLALITGGAQGIGAETARVLAADGLRVAIADRNLDGAEEVIAGLPGDGHSAWPVDVRDEGSVKDLFDAVEAAHGPVGVMACCAGGPYLHQGVTPKVADTTLETWIGTEALNARGTFLCMREMLRRRQATPVADGRIIALSSRAGLMPSIQTGPSYAAAKAAVIGLARIAALEAAPLGITVNVVAPGMIDTPAIRADLTDEQIARANTSTPVGHIGAPINIAKTIAFAVTPEAGYMTGAILEVNGGTHFA
jgi:3-oxoacyl-[acyl-carrier protein] reductase